MIPTMRDFLILFVHMIVTLARPELQGPADSVPLSPNPR
jgi:hypothetical protein